MKLTSKNKLVLTVAALTFALAQTAAFAQVTTTSNGQTDSGQKAGQKAGQKSES